MEDSQQTALTTTFEVFCIGTNEKIDAVSFQAAARQWMIKRDLIGVASILVDDNQHGAIEFLECRIIDGTLVYDDYDVHNTHDADSETLERLNFYASLKDSPDRSMSEVITCQACKATFADNDAFQIHLGVGAPAFHRCLDSHEMQVHGMFKRNRPDEAWCIPAVFVEHHNDWAYLNSSLLKQYIDEVKQEAKRYWSGGNEPVQITDAWIARLDSNGDVEVMVSWVSESTKDEMRDDMIYTVYPLPGNEVDVHGPEW